MLQTLGCGNVRKDEGWGRWGLVPVKKTKVADIWVYIHGEQERKNEKRESGERGKARKRERLFSKKYF